MKTCVGFGFGPIQSALFLYEAFKSGNFSRFVIAEVDQKTVDDEFVAHDILTNCRKYPLDEAPAAYKDFGEVLRSVECAGLASTVAALKARFVIKDSDESLKGAA